MALTPEDEQNWTSSKLVIHSSAVTVQEITDLLGAQPTRSSNRNNPADDRQADDKSVWSHASVLSSDASLEEHIDALLAIIEARPEAWRDLMNRGDTWARIQCAISPRSGQAASTLEPDLLTRLAAASVFVWLTVYR